MYVPDFRKGTVSSCCGIFEIFFCDPFALTWAHGNCLANRAGLNLAALASLNASGQAGALGAIQNLIATNISKMPTIQL